MRRYQKETGYFWVVDDMGGITYGRGRRELGRRFLRRKEEGCSRLDYLKLKFACSSPAVLRAGHGADGTSFASQSIPISV